MSANINKNLTDSSGCVLSRFSLSTRCKIAIHLLTTSPFNAAFDFINVMSIVTDDCFVATHMQLHGGVRPEP